MPNLPPSTAQTVNKLVKRYLRLVPRKVSKPFKAGVRVVVWLRFRGYVLTKASFTPYKKGTPAFDAFRYGVAFAESVA